MNPLYLSVVEVERFSLVDSTDIYLFVLHSKMIDLMLI
jgi:hypothetical protein